MDETLTDTGTWETPIRTQEGVKPALAALLPYPVRSWIRNAPAPGQELIHEQMRDRLIECLAHRLHAIFEETWNPAEAPILQPNELPMITGAGACIISLADAKQGWPSRRMAAFHEKAKAGVVMGNVDLELLACWVLRQRLGITDDKAKLDMLIDPSSVDLMLEKMVTPEHAARNQSFELHQGTSGVAMPQDALRAGPRL